MGSREPPRKACEREERVRLTRRQLVTGAGALALALPAAGCGSPPQEPWADGTYWSDGTGWVEEPRDWF